MSELSSRLRARLIEALTLLADEALQRKYQSSAPHVDVPAELFNQWEESYLVGDAEFRSAFDASELDALRVLDAVVKDVSASTPKQLPPLEAFVATEPWRRLSEAARVALQRFDGPRREERETASTVVQQSRGAGMQESQFWDRVEEAARDRQGAFQRALDAMSDEDLEEFVAEYGAHRRALLDPEFVKRPDPPVPIKDLAGIADRVVAQGRDRFERVFSGEEALVAPITQEAGSSPADDAAATYKRRTGRWVPRRAPDSDAIELGEDAFWALVALGGGDLAAFRRALADLRPADLIVFHGVFFALRNRLQGLVSARGLDGDLADALMLEGRARVQAIQAHPDDASMETSRKLPVPVLDDQAASVFERRFGEDIPLPSRWAAKLLRGGS
jgi:hypothetical protein